MTTGVDKLIAEVKKRPAIYNYQMAEHTDKRVIERCWKEVATELRCSAIECKNKWTCLRSSYARYMRAEKAAESGSEEYKPRKPWYRAEAMSFLKQNMSIQRTSTAPKSRDEASPANEDALTTSTSSIFKNELYSDGNDTADLSISKANTTSEPAISPSIRVANILPETISSTVVQMRPEEVAEDPTLVFFKSLLPDMQKLSERKQRQLKQDFLMSLNNLLDEEENEP